MVELASEEVGVAGKEASGDLTTVEFPSRMLEHVHPPLWGHFDEVQTAVVEGAHRNPGAPSKAEDRADALARSRRHELHDAVSAAREQEAHGAGDVSELLEVPDRLQDPRLGVESDDSPRDARINRENYGRRVHFSRKILPRPPQQPQVRHWKVPVPPQEEQTISTPY